MTEPRPEDLWQIDPAADDLVATEEHRRVELGRAAQERAAQESAAKQHRARIAAARWRLAPFCLRFLRGALALVMLLIGGTAIAGEAMESPEVVAVIGLTVVIGFPLTLVIDRLLHGRLRRWEHVVLAGLLGAGVTLVFTLSTAGSAGFLVVAAAVIGAVLAALVRMAAGFRGVALRD